MSSQDQNFLARKVFEQNLSTQGHKYMRHMYTHTHSLLSGRFIDAAILSLSPWCTGLPSHLGYCSAAAIKSGAVRENTHTDTHTLYSHLLDNQKQILSK